MDELFGVLFELVAASAGGRGRPKDLLITSVATLFGIVGAFLIVKPFWSSGGAEGIALLLMPAGGTAAVGLLANRPMRRILMGTVTATAVTVAVMIPLTIVGLMTWSF